MRMYRASMITIFVLLQALTGCKKDIHKNVIYVSPLSYPYAAPGEYLEWRKSSPGLPDFLVVFTGESPCGSVNEVLVTGTTPNGCNVVSNGGTTTYPVAYDIYVVPPPTHGIAPTPPSPPPIPPPPTWPKDIPFNVVKCGVCGSALQVGSSGDSGSSSTSVTPSTASSRAQKGGGAGSSSAPNIGNITCASDQAGTHTTVTPMTVSIKNDTFGIWQELGEAKQDWTITNFQPSSPCSGATTISYPGMCTLSATGTYTYQVTATACTSQQPFTGSLTVNP